jgi:hypothetical protein
MKFYVGNAPKNSRRKFQLQSTNVEKKVNTNEKEWNSMSGKPQRIPDVNFNYKAQMLKKK